MLKKSTIGLITTVEKKRCNCIISYGLWSVCIVHFIGLFVCKNDKLIIFFITKQQFIISFDNNKANTYIRTVLATLVYEKNSIFYVHNLITKKRWLSCCCSRLNATFDCKPIDLKGAEKASGNGKVSVCMDVNTCT